MPKDKKMTKEQLKEFFTNSKKIASDRLATIEDSRKQAFQEAKNRGNINSVQFEKILNFETYDDDKNTPILTPKLAEGNALFNKLQGELNKEGKTSLNYLKDPKALQSLQAKLQSRGHVNLISEISEIIPKVRNETNENLRKIESKNKDDLSSFYKKNILFEQNIIDNKHLLSDSDSVNSAKHRHNQFTLLIKNQEIVKSPATEKNKIKKDSQEYLGYSEVVKGNIVSQADSNTKAHTLKLEQPKVPTPVLNRVQFFEPKPAQQNPLVTMDAAEKRKGLIFLNPISQNVSVLTEVSLTSQCTGAIKKTEKNNKEQQLKEKQLKQQQEQQEKQLKQQQEQQEKQLKQQQEQQDQQLKELMNKERVKEKQELLQNSLSTHSSTLFRQTPSPIQSKRKIGGNETLVKLNQ